MIRHFTTPEEAHLHTPEGTAEQQAKFNHLHLHTEFSTLDGVNRIDAFPDYLKANGFETACITDHGVVAGHWAFYKKCKDIGIRPILGMEAYYTVGDRHIRERDELGKPYYHLILLAKNNAGLKNLYALSTKAFTEGTYYKPRIDDDLLAQYSEGIAATSACLGARSSQLILAGQHKAAQAILEHHAAIFKDRFFVELQLHETPEQRKVNEVLIHMAGKLKLPLVITSDAHYTHEHDKHFHETTLRMATQRNASDEDAFSFGDLDCHLHTHDEMVVGCRAQNIPLEAVTNTAYVASMIDSDDYFSDRRNRIPKFKHLPEGITSWQYLEAIAWAGLQKRVGWPVPEEYEARFRSELALFKKLGITDYLLIIQEIVSKANELDCWTGPGRGSAAGSLICWALGITQLDPIKYGLIVERFIHDGRSGTPLIFD